MDWTGRRLCSGKRGTIPPELFVPVCPIPVCPFPFIRLAGEFGGTPWIFNVAPKIYKLPGRDHWAPAQSILLAGGGIRGGTVVGATDRNGAYVTSDPQSPENFAATIYDALGIPRDANWYDMTNRPYHIYQADPIRGLS